MFERYVITDNFLSIPLSGNNFLINYTGEIKDRDGVLIPKCEDIDGNEIVCLDLWNGYQNYKVAILVALTFKSINIPINYWNRLDVLFVDSNNKNIHPSNLVWKFPEGGLIHNFFLDYAYIPGFTNYAISNSGELIHARNGKPINFHYDTGYAKFRISPDMGNSTSIGRHRLVCLAWLQYTSNIDSLVTNHLNGIPGDDRVINLEWSTRKENNVHAWKTGLQSINSTIQMRNVNTGECKEFLGYVECAKFLGLNKDTIKYRVKAKNQPVYPGYLQFKLKVNNESWREVTDSEKLIEKKLHIGVSVSIKSRNIVTGEIKSYLSIVDASIDTKCHVNSLHQQLKLITKNRPINGFNFKYENDNSPWPIYSENEMVMYLASPVNRTIGVVVTDIETNKEHVFTTYYKAAIFLNIKVELISRAIKKKTLIKNQYSVKRI